MLIFKYTIICRQWKWSLVQYIIYSYECIIKLFEILFQAGLPYDSRLYTVYLSKEERDKHIIYTNMVERDMVSIL